MEFTKESVGKLLSSKTIISEAGVEYTLKVTNVTNGYQGSNGVVNIINYAAITQGQLGIAMDHLRKGNLSAAANISVSSNARPGKDFTPVKGQLVNVVFTQGQTKSGEPALFVQSVTPLAKAVASTVDFKALAMDLGWDEDTTDAVIDANKLTVEE